MLKVAFHVKCKLRPPLMFNLCFDSRASAVEVIQTALVLSSTHSEGCDLAVQSTTVTYYAQ